MLTKEESEWIKNTCPRERKRIIENLNRHKSEEVIDGKSVKK